MAAAASGCDTDTDYGQEEKDYDRLEQFLKKHRLSEYFESLIEQEVDFVALRLLGNAFFFEVILHFNQHHLTCCLLPLPLAVQYPEIAEKRMKDMSIRLGHRRKLVKALEEEPIPLLLPVGRKSSSKTPETASVPIVHRGNNVVSWCW